MGESGELVESDVARTLPVAGGAAPLWRRLGIAVLAVAVVLGLVARLWLLHAQPLNSDEAVVGLMADQIRHGHFYTFYWGQQYGGVEPYVVALVTAVAGTSPLVVNFVPTLLWALACVLMWRIGRYMLPEGWNAAAVAIAVALWVATPMAYISNTHELGLHGVAVALGVAVVWACLRLVRSPTVGNFFLAGLIAGLGWWSSPEVTYFLLPALGALASGAVRPARWLIAGESAAVGWLVGAAPWLIDNLRSGYQSVLINRSPGQGQTTFFSRLGIFFTKTLPLELGVRKPFNLTWTPGLLGQILYFVLLVGLAALCVSAFRWRPASPNRLSRRSVRLMAAGVLLFPLEYAALPATWYWRDGRYAVYLIPLLALLALATAPMVAGWIGRPGVVGGDVVPEGVVARGVVVGGAWFAGVAVLGAVAFTSTFLHGDPTNVFRGWGNPNRAVQASARELVRSGVRYGQADYWTAYTMTYLSHGSLQVAPTYTVRWAAQRRAVLRQPAYTFLFFSPDQYEVAFGELGAAGGPNGYTETTYLQYLQSLHVPYTVVRGGALDAVVVPRPAPPSVAARANGAPGSAGGAPGGPAPPPGPRA